MAWCNTLLDFSILTLFCQGSGLFYLALIFCILAQGTAATSPRSQGGPPPRSWLTLLRLGLGLLHLLTASATLHCTPNVETVGPILKPIFPFCSRCVGSPRTRSSCPISMSEWTKTCRKRHVTIAKQAASMTLNETSVGSSRSFIRLGTVSTCSTSIHTESMYVRVGRGARRFESKAPFYQC